MSEERRIFETRIKEYKDRASNALDIINSTADLFNSYGFPFCIGNKETLLKKCKDGFVKHSVEAKLNKAKCGNARADYFQKIAYRYSLIEKILTEQAKKAKEALRLYGRVIIYDNARLCFFIDWDKLESDAVKYAEYMEQ